MANGTSTTARPGRGGRINWNDSESGKLAAKFGIDLDQLWGEAQHEAGADDRIADILDQLMDQGKLDRESALQAISAWERGGLEGFEDALRRSDRIEEGAVSGLADYLRGEEQGEVHYGDFVGDIESQGALAHADEASRDAQYEALDKLRGWTDPEMTAEEKFLMAQARQTEERDMRAAREAALRDLEMRGIRSGAAEMGAFLGGQGITSRNRMVQDLGAQANAVERALGATEAFGKQGDVISKQSFDERFLTGEQEDAVAQFNNKLRTDHNRDKARFKIDQQDMRFGRERDLADRRIGLADNRANRAGMAADAGMQTTGMRAAVHTGQNPVVEGLKLALGAEEAERARRELKPEEKGGLFGTGIGPDFSF